MSYQPTGYDPMQTLNVLNHILANMPHFSKWQRRFLPILFATLFALRGRVTFTNLARFSPLHEHTFRRHFEKGLDWVAFNQAVIDLADIKEQPRLGVFDCSFIRKSGRHTYGLDRFWSCEHDRSKQGLEISLLGCIATETRQAFALDVTQTPPRLSTDEKADDSSSSYSRIDFYMEQFLDLLEVLEDISHMVADGNYARRKVFDTVTAVGKDLITRLRSDANLRYLHDGSRKPGQRGRTPRYAGKVQWKRLQLSRWAYVGTLDDHQHVALYTQVLNSPHYKRDFRVALLLKTKTDKYVLLASTDIEQSAQQIVAYYRLRFQVEFLFRDAKQFTGLEHAQARSEAKLDFHFNLSLAAVNVARLVMADSGLSFNSYVRRTYNRYVVEQVLVQLGLEAEYDLNDPLLRPVLDIGRMAA